MRASATLLCAEMLVLLNNRRREVMVSKQGRDYFHGWSLDGVLEKLELQSFICVF